MRAIVVTPTYNERDNIEEFIHRVFSHAPAVHILIVDDNSPDDTGEIVERLREEYSGRLLILHRTEKAGLGRAYVAGFRHALAAGYDVIVQMDADLSHDPAYIPSFLARMANCDLVIGSRYRNGINVVNWDFRRLLLSKAATAYVRLITHMPITDATGGFKCWRRKALEQIDLDGVFSNGYLFQVETTWKAYRANMAVDELPIIFYERSGGASKMNWPIVWEAVWGVLRLRFLPGLRRKSQGAAPAVPAVNQGS